MGYLDELKPRLTFDRWDYVRALRALLPRGILWNIPLPDERDIRPNSILSGEQFGRVTVSLGMMYITPDGIASAEDFGLPYIYDPNSSEIQEVPYTTVSESWQEQDTALEIIQEVDDA